jgi:hypothetical protein
MIIWIDAEDWQYCLIIAICAERKLIGLKLKRGIKGGIL